MKIGPSKRATAKPVALDPKAQAARYGKSWMTLSQRWANDPEIRYPRPDFYVGKTPYTYVTTLDAWEQSLPKEGPGQAVIRRAENAEAA